MHDTRDVPYTYKRQTTVIPAATGDFCPACGESIFDMVESRRAMNIMNTFTKKVNSSMVDPAS